MKDLKYFQNIIKEKRKKTDFRDFLKEVASWKPFPRLHWLDRIKLGFGV